MKLNMEQKQHRLPARHGGGSIMAGTPRYHRRGKTDYEISQIPLQDKVRVLCVVGPSETRFDWSILGPIRSITQVT